MAELKTQRTKASVSAFLNAIEDPDKRRDAKAVHKLMKEVTGAKPAMWGPSIVGYGTYRFRYESGREGEWMLTGFSPRKQALTLYIMAGFTGSEPLLEKLGKFKTGKACLYVKKLEDIDMKVLERLVRKSVKAKSKTRTC